LTWTTEKPTQAGWYWFDQGGHGLWRMVEVKCDHKKKLYAEGFKIEADYFNGHWSGPLRTPKEGK